MTENDAYLFKQPTLNRSRKWGGFKAGHVIIDNKKFETFSDASDYLDSFPRTDIKKQFPKLYQRT